MYFNTLSAVKWLKYCRYGVKQYPINQHVISIYLRQRLFQTKEINIQIFLDCGIDSAVTAKLFTTSHCRDNCPMNDNLRLLGKP